MTIFARNFAGFGKLAMGLAAILSATALLSSAAEAKHWTPKWTHPKSDVCVLLKGEDEKQAFVANSGAKILAPQCEIHVKSEAKPAAIFNADAHLLVAKTCVEGNTVITNGGPVPSLETGCDTVKDPYAKKIWELRKAIYRKNLHKCDYENYQPKDGKNIIRMEPGVYCGWTNFNANRGVILKPGVYVIRDGGWNVNSGVKFIGKGVTFYFHDSSIIQFNANVKVLLQAPKSGYFKGILMYEKRDLEPSNIAINGDGVLPTILEGLIYLPSRNAMFNSDNVKGPNRAGMVFNTLIMNETFWLIKPLSDSKLPSKK